MRKVIKALYPIVKFLMHEKTHQQKSDSVVGRLNETSFSLRNNSLIVFQSNYIFAVIDVGKGAEKTCFLSVKDCI